MLTCDAKGTKEDTNNAMKQWASAKQRMVVNPVLIISYESLRMYAPVLAQTPIGLMLCDEGHRLKNSGMSEQMSIMVEPASYSHNRR